MNLSRCLILAIWFSFQTIQVSEAGGVLGKYLNPRQTALIELENGIFEAAKRGRIKYLTRALDLEIDPDLSDEYGNTLLHWAVSYGQIDAVKLLLERGADINLSSPHAGTPVQIAMFGQTPTDNQAAYFLRPQVLNLLLKNNKLNFDREIRFAQRVGRKDFVKRLVTAKSRLGMMPR